MGTFDRASAELIFFALAVLFSVIIWMVSFGTAYRAWRGAYNKSVRISDLAGKLKMQYYFKSTFTMDPAYKGGPFKGGSGREGRDIICGVMKDHPVIAFEYHKIVKTDNQKQVITTMIAAAWIGGNTPFIEVKKEGPISDLPGDILIESIEFNKRFRITSPNREAAIHFLSPQVVSYVLQYGSKIDGFWVENGWIFTEWPVNKGDGMIEDMHRGMGLVSGVASTFPKWLGKEHGTEAGQGNTAPRPEVVAERILPGLNIALKFPRKKKFSTLLGESLAGLVGAVGDKMGDYFRMRV